MPFEFEKCLIPDVLLIKPRVFSDHRGFFMESFKSSDFIMNGVSNDFVQDNHSCSDKGVLRGMHFQKGDKAQGKLVRVVQGSVLDVAVDIRPESSTFKQVVMKQLSAENSHMLWVPLGMAHGFLTLKNNTHFLYKCSDSEYDPASEYVLNWDDPSISIDWPKHINISLSDKDLSKGLSLIELMSYGVIS